MSLPAEAFSLDTREKQVAKSMESQDQDSSERQLRTRLLTSLVQAEGLRAICFNDDGTITAEWLCATATFKPVRVNGGASRRGIGRVIEFDTSPAPLVETLQAITQNGAEGFHDPRLGSGIRLDEEAFVLGVIPARDQPAPWMVLPGEGYERGELEAVNEG